MNWKIAATGLALVVALLAAFSTSNVVVGFVGATIHIRIPEAVLEDVTMYGRVYLDDGSAPAIFQSVGSLTCPQGQVITRIMYVAGMRITAELSMAYAELSNVEMYAADLSSTSGTLNSVQMKVEDYPKGVTQTIESGTMYELETDIYFVSIGSMSYQNLEIKLIIEQL